MKSRALVALAALMLAGCEKTDDAVVQGGTFEFISPGGQTVIKYPESERAPLGELSGPNLRDESQTISLSDYAGKIVVLNSWGQWCAPCRSESDDLQRVHEALGDNGTVLGINIRDYNPQISRDFLEDNGLDYPSIYDPPFKTALALGGIPTSVVPTTVVLDRKHRPAAVFLKETTDTELLEVIKELEQE
ncbi:effector protein [Corynebacterium phocae]|uniref:Effector protein n=1 Tax=Corynebacterium phocae TaxID=161895 RepID=A0A1L7D189_9CORY|nr:TlpA disulfide reductase family protein [Corynebacterium phocae]APT91833.1 effector protein [Corynebacterium phocae]KAA8727443.1 TlpA family protein disulfide reductase [Corynebacterium phocae]